MPRCATVSEEKSKTQMIFLALPFFFSLKFRVSEVSIHCCSLATGPQLKSSPFFSHVNGYQLTPTIQTNFACLAAADLGQEVLLGFVSLVYRKKIQTNRCRESDLGLLHVFFSFLEFLTTFPLMFPTEAKHISQ